MAASDDVAFPCPQWDAPGQKDLRTKCVRNLKTAQGIVLVYDVSDADSFADLESWAALIKECVQLNAACRCCFITLTIARRVSRHASPTAELVLVGNKSDLSRGTNARRAKVPPLAHCHSL